jgi:hypothetical protein
MPGIAAQANKSAASAPENRGRPDCFAERCDVVVLADRAGLVRQLNIR